MTNYCYLKIQKHGGTNALVDTIPLRVNTVSISTDKTIPAFPIPLSGLATGESSTVAFDLGMSNKRISLSGFITETEIRRSHTKTAGVADTLNFTPQEVAQLIASGVDSTGLAKYQAINELVVLMPSKVDEDYVQVSERNIPFTFKARGSANSKDNYLVAAPGSFPTSETSRGLRGFISSFSCTLSSDSVDIEFTLEFTCANVLP